MSFIWATSMSAMIAESNDVVSVIRKDEDIGLADAADVTVLRNQRT